ncbi:hypothetical protein OKA04_19770 [Luteolibacter flavescens]|uniref:HEAT repeat domain-containing protein n=1 Tax=Luteolibacter flavescens TaxID=1859460 RepID=A0ABT3FU80_9BACT|nr:hypothetical protein [Luteolibacter flavescens]MCW1886987.1 hypothetical protein [Luteolibacter flavescens]
MSRLLMICAVAAAFATGYTTSRVSSGGRDSGADSAGNPSPSRESDSRAAASHSTEDRPWKEVQQRIVSRWEASPGITVDFELRDETERALERIPPEDLETWMRNLRSTMWTDRDEDVPYELCRMLLKVLAQRGGGDFIQALNRNPMEHDQDDVSEAMGHWITHDPAAALDWLAGEVPEVISEDLDDHRADALITLAGRDPVEFEKRFDRETDPDLREVAQEAHARLWGTPEERDELLARAETASHGEAMAIREGVLMREGMEDPEQAFATLAALEISPEDRDDLDERLVSSLFYWNPFTREKIDRSAVMRAWTTRHPDDELPGSILGGFSDWSRSDPNGSITWLAELPPGNQYDTLAKTLIETGTREHEGVASVIERISDEEIRAEMLRRLKESWQADNPDAAAAWESGLPEKDRAGLE